MWIKKGKGQVRKPTADKSSNQEGACEPDVDLSQNQELSATAIKYASSAQMP